MFNLKKNFLAKTVKSQSGIEVRTYNTSLTYLTPSFSLRLGTNSVLVIQLSDSRKGSGRYAYCQLTGELGDYWRGSKVIRQSGCTTCRGTETPTTKMNKEFTSHPSHQICQMVQQMMPITSATTFVSGLGKYFIPKCGWSLSSEFQNSLDFAWDEPEVPMIQPIRWVTTICHP